MSDTVGYCRQINSYGYELDPAFSGKWIKCIIQLNQYHLQQDTNRIQEVAAHEMGHAMGLKHGGRIDTLMYPYESRTVMVPTQDEFNGIAYLYS